MYLIYYKYDDEVGHSDICSPITYRKFETQMRLRYNLKDSGVELGRQAGQEAALKQCGSEMAVKPGVGFPAQPGGGRSKSFSAEVTSAPSHTGRVSVAHKKK